MMASQQNFTKLFGKNKNTLCNSITKSNQNEELSCNKTYSKKG